MRKYVLLLVVACAALAYLGTCFFPSDERPMVVVIPSYKNADWYDKNLSSIFAQKYRNYRVVYVDDDSPDNTYELVAKKIQSLGQQHRSKVIKNETRRGALANIYHAIHEYCQDDEIVVLLDGDDWFKHDRVFQTLNETYADTNVWMTYGQYEEYPKGLGKRTWWAI